MTDLPTWMEIFKAATEKAAATQTTMSPPSRPATSMSSPVEVSHQDFHWWDGSSPQQLSTQQSTQAPPTPRNSPCTIYDEMSILFTGAPMLRQVVDAVATPPQPEAAPIAPTHPPQEAAPTLVAATPSMTPLLLHGMPLTYLLFGGFHRNNNRRI